MAHPSVVDPANEDGGTSIPRFENESVSGRDDSLSPAGAFIMYSQSVKATSVGGMRTDEPSGICGERTRSSGTAGDTGILPGTTCPYQVAAMTGGRVRVDTNGGAWYGVTDPREGTFDFREGR
ncbi:MAG: hypothetical protein NVS4B2_24980 [Chloroflexota bacterium]